MPVRLRTLAADDFTAAVDYYRTHAGEQTTLDFVDAAQRLLIRIGRSPTSGSLRFAYDLNIPNLRAVGVDRFPYVVFYVIADDEIDVWRVLHARRDVNTQLDLTNQ